MDSGTERLPIIASLAAATLVTLVPLEKRSLLLLSLLTALVETLMFRLLMLCRENALESYR